MKISNTLSIIIILMIIGSCKKKNTEIPFTIEDKINTEFDNPLIISNATDKKTIDLDKDGINDIIFTVRSATDINTLLVHYYCAEPLRDDVQIVNVGVNFAYSFPKNSVISENNTIDATMRWTSSLGILLEKTIFNNQIERIGMFNGSNHLHLGVRIQKGLNISYGWIEIKHQTELTIDQIQITKASINKKHTISIKAGDL